MYSSVPGECVYACTFGPDTSGVCLPVLLCTQCTSVMWIALWFQCMLSGSPWSLQGCVCSKLVYRGGTCVQYMHHCISRAVVSPAHPSVHTLDCLPSAVGDREPVRWRLKLLISPICKCSLMPCIIVISTVTVMVAL